MAFRQLYRYYIFNKIKNKKMIDIPIKKDYKVVDFIDSITPITLQHFREKYWEKEYLYIDRKNTDFYESIFSLKQVDKLLDTCLIKDKVMLVRDGSMVLPSLYENKDGSLNLNQIYSSYDDGCTVVINGINYFWHPLKTYCAEMSSILSSQAFANMYLTPKNEKGLSPHYDTHDVYILQISGKKHWKIYDSPIQTPILNSKQPVFDREELGTPEELTLRAGDFMYLPRGLTHEAYTGDESSLHITIGVNAAQWMDLIIHSIKELAKDEIALRKALPFGYLNRKMWDAEFAEKFTGQFQEVLSLLSENLKLQKGISALADKRWKQKNPNGDGHFLELDKLDSLTLDSQLRVREGLNCRVKLEGDKSKIIFPGNFVTGSKFLLTTFQFIGQHKEGFTLRDLPIISDPNKIKLARRLIRGGLLKTIN